ncbi:Fic family protein [Flagellimonas lutaonensis]|uniref:Cell filamentation protein Fic n=1 Tax=Flagellimonas lutaonensis TaxID=516051 RepID=A0A0D5YTV8_9FLAO|nr:Fic family protein [Allomuricauda lutaonensis]AKA35329.1 cell filamentation protein Fic [Allomuricauda lutaonensis]
MRYNWQQKDWPNFQYQTTDVENKLFDFAQRTGRISGVLEGLSETEQTEAIINLMVSEAIKTSEIEGEYLSRNDVMSSIRRNLGLNPELPLTKDKRAEGVAELMLAVRNNFKKPLTSQMLFDWHTMLMKGNNQIQIGQWRTHEEPMQIVSGGMGREMVHFEAPPSKRVSTEMSGFIKWFNASQGEIKKPILRAAIAHLYFETIHPFEDGNGRIGRAVAEKALSQRIGRPVLFSLSKSIEENKKAYYDALQRAQRSNEITDWINYFVQTVLDAQIDAEQEIEFTLKKTRFFDQHKDELNERQQKVVRRMLEEGHQGFEGGMNSRKYISLVRTSKATATRDLQDLVAKGIFRPIGGGRSTRYEINI